MRRPREPPARAVPPTPDGWHSIQPPPAQHKKSFGHPSQDSLGLAKGVHASQIKVPRIQDNNREDVAGDSPRHRKLQQPLTQHRDLAVADAFAPNKSLRLACLRPPSEDDNERSAVSRRQRQRQQDDEVFRRSGLLASPHSRASRFRETTQTILSLHETVRGFDDAIDASPLGESNQTAITELFLADWLDRFEKERELYKSIVVHAEVAFRELYRVTANLALPNDVVTAFGCKILDDMAAHFGPFSNIMRVFCSELRQSIYVSTVAPHSSKPLPYFAIVKNQKRILQSLRKDQLRRQERNDFLRYEIEKVHATFHHFLDQCGLGLVRTIFREWYFVAVTSKRNSRKYVEYFSAWFGGSAKSLVPRAFLAWKHQSVERKVARMHEQLASDQEKLSVMQKQIDEFTVQRNLAQLESLAIRNDRKHAEDTIQRLHRKIQSASAFLEVTHRREALVAQEAQLRVEAVTFLPPLVLESLLRGFHNVGFLQALHSEFTLSPAKKTGPMAGPRGPLAAGLYPQPTEPSALQRCISALQSVITAHPPTLPSLEDARHDQRRQTLHTNSIQVDDGDSKESHDSAASCTSEIPLHECLALLRGMKSRVEIDPTAYLLFLSKTDLVHTAEISSPKPQAEDDQTPDGSVNESPLALQEFVELFEASLRGVRHQDDHYARHSKLFSSRMLEQNEISVVPHTQMMVGSGSRPVISKTSLAGVETAPIPGLQNEEPAPSRVAGRVMLSSIDSARSANNTFTFAEHLDEQNDAEVSLSLEQLPLVRARDLELSPRHTRAFIILSLGQLVAEYGSLLFSPADLSAFVRNRILQKVMLRGIAGGKHTIRKFHVPILDEAGGDDGDELRSDDEDATDNSIPELKPNSRKKPEGVGMLRKQTTQRRMELAPRRKSSYPGLHAPIANDIDRGLACLKTTYDLWNQLSSQLAQAEIVQARGVMASSDVRPVDSRTGVGKSGIAHSDSTVLDSSAEKTAAVMLMRPRLQLHIEPLASGPLLSAAKDKDLGDAPTTPNGSHRSSMATVSSTEWSYETSKVRPLSLVDVRHLREAVEGLHGIVRGSTQSRMAAYAAAKQTLRDIRCMQWHEASDLASQFTHWPSRASAATTVIDPAPEPALGFTPVDDDRRHIFECVSFDNDAIERLFSVEEHPEDELHRVQSLLERKKHIVRHAFYCKHRPGITHVATLEDLWHVVKVLRLTRDVRVLPTLRDEDLVGTMYSNEQLFSVDDLAEVLLQLCNEQFLPHITPLSARVEFLLTHHLPLAMQNQSAMREIMYKTDVKKALGDHGQTLRMIFRRYCAKEKDILAAAAAKRRAAIVAANSSAVGSTAPSPPAAQSPSNAAAGTSLHSVAVTPPQGITRFMRLADWHAFITDYKLLRARFTAEYATVVFCNVQEAESGLEDNLEMIYGEFTEAIVALSVCFFPDPFLRHATRIHQFIRRYLPVSPEEIRDHHA